MAGKASPVTGRTLAGWPEGIPPVSSHTVVINQRKSLRSPPNSLPIPIKERHRRHVAGPASKPAQDGRLLYSDTGAPTEYVKGPGDIDNLCALGVRFICIGSCLLTHV